MSSSFGRARYTVQVVGRGGGPIRCEVPYSSITFSRNLDTTTEANVSIPASGTSTTVCCDVFSQSEPWRDELLIFRDTTPVWGGPIIRRSVSQNGGELFAQDFMAWMDRRFIEETVHLEGDLSYIFEELWTYGYDKDPFGVDIITRDTGTDGIRDFYAKDFNQVSGVLSELSRTGVDWYIDGGQRLVVVGGPDSFQPTTTPILHDDATLGVEVDEDGSQFATDVAVFASGAKTGEDPVIGRATGQVSVYGLLQASFTELLIKDTPSADANALARLESVQPAARTLRVPLSDRAGFDYDALYPGMQMDVRLAQAAGCLEINDIMRVSQFETSVAVSETGATENITLTLVPLGLMTDA